MALKAPAPTQALAPAHVHQWKEHKETREEWVLNIVTVSDVGFYNKHAFYPSFAGRANMDVQSIVTKPQPAKSS